MSDLLLGKKHRKEPIELQLTAMIDIFSMIVIFLILGSVFGASEMFIPKGLKVPLSLSKESADAAPRLVIHESSVSFSGFDGALPLSAFRRTAASPDPALGAFRDRLKGYLETQRASQPQGQPQKPRLLNVIADQATPYSDLFDVVKVFRETGFESLLFVASGEGKKK